MSDAAFIASLRAAESHAEAKLVIWREHVARGEAAVKSLRDLIACYTSDEAVVARSVTSPTPSKPVGKINTAPKDAAAADLSPVEFTVWRALAKRISETGLSPLYVPFARETRVGIMALPRTIDALCQKGYVRRTGNRRTTMLHVDKWPEGIAARETTAREDGHGTGQRASKQHPSSVGGKPNRRFDHAEFDPANVIPLAADNPALTEKRTLFPTTVVAAADSPRLLVSGANQRKLGDRVTKGKWSGMPIFALTLEERKTCPQSCAHLRDCYGNGMPLARRHKVDGDFWPKMHGELVALQTQYPKGFVVRLHVLGDFVDVDYVTKWADALGKYPALHVFGYTAWLPDTNVGYQILKLRDSVWGRFAIRFSSPKPLPGGATTIDRRVRGRCEKGIVCPAQTDDTDCCGSCGLCWSDGFKDKTIVFMMHGRSTGRVGRPIGSGTAASLPVPRGTPHSAPAPKAAPGQGRKPGTVWSWSPADVSAEDWEARTVETVRRLGTGATPGAVAAELKTQLVHLATALNNLVDRNILREMKTPDGRGRYFVVRGSDLDPNAKDHNDTDLNQAIAVCRKDGDCINKVGKDLWRVNSATLDRDGLIARAERIANKRKALGMVS